MAVTNTENYYDYFGIFSLTYLESGGQISGLTHHANMEINSAGATGFSGDTWSVSSVYEYYGYVIIDGEEYPVMSASNSTYYYILSDTDLDGKTFSPVVTGEPPCFLGETSIKTPNGSVKIADLNTGDLILTADNQTVPIKFLFTLTLQYPFYNIPKTHPIRFSKGCISDDLPTADLLISPAHAILIEDSFMRADTLINGLSITQEKTMPERFTYYHIELENHELIVAEGVPAETFTGPRGLFDNYDDYIALYGEQAVMQDMQRSRIKTTEQVPLALKKQLMERAILPSIDKTKSVA